MSNTIEEYEEFCSKMEVKRKIKPSRAVEDQRIDNYIIVLTFKFYDLLR